MGINRERPLADGGADLVLDDRPATEGVEGRQRMQQDGLHVGDATSPALLLVIEGLDLRRKRAAPGVDAADMAHGKPPDRMGRDESFIAQPSSIWNRILAFGTQKAFFLDAVAPAAPTS